jgi:hypothetical protein
VAVRPLVRRIYTQAEPLHAPDDPATMSVSGPYVVSGAWWRGGVHREYYFGRTPHGEVWWYFYDRQKRRFFLQGRVE